jgi:hypothetical protein
MFSFVMDYKAYSVGGNCPAGVAQLAEQLICNQQVAGSSPITSSIRGWVPERLKGADCKSAVTDFGGSNPPPSTTSTRHRNGFIMRIWRNWQTRTVQVRVRAISWRFKSSYPHQRRVAAHNIAHCLLTVRDIFVPAPKRCIFFGRTRHKKRTVIL